MSDHPSFSLPFEPLGLPYLQTLDRKESKVRNASTYGGPHEVHVLKHEAAAQTVKHLPEGYKAYSLEYHLRSKRMNIDNTEIIMIMNLTSMERR